MNHRSQSLVLHVQRMVACGLFLRPSRAMVVPGGAFDSA